MVHSHGTSSIPILPQHFRQNHLDVESSNTMPRFSLSLHREADKVLNNDFLRWRVDHLILLKSDSEMSLLADEPPKKKACGKSKVSSAFPPPPHQENLKILFFTFLTFLQKSEKSKKK